MIPFRSPYQMPKMKAPFGENTFVDAAKPATEIFSRVHGFIHNIVTP